MQYIKEFIDFNIPFNKDSVKSLGNNLKEYKLIRHYFEQLIDTNINISISETDFDNSHLIFDSSYSARRLGDIGGNYGIEISGFFRTENPYKVDGEFEDIIIKLSDELFDCIYMIDSPNINLTKSYLSYPLLGGSRKTTFTEFKGKNQFNSLALSLYNASKKDRRDKHVMDLTNIYFHFQVN